MLPNNSHLVLRQRRPHDWHQMFPASNGPRSACIEPRRGKYSFPMAKTTTRSSLMLVWQQTTSIVCGNRQSLSHSHSTKAGCVCLLLYSSPLHSSPSPTDSSNYLPSFHHSISTVRESIKPQVTVIQQRQTANAISILLPLSPYAQFFPRN